MTHCPTCGQSIVKAAKRRCADCGKPIGTRHKYFFGEDGRVRHRVCENPTSYARMDGEQPSLIEEEQPECEKSSPKP